MFVTITIAILLVVFICGAWQAGEETK